MATPETRDEASYGKSWTYNTRYDVVRWAEFAKLSAEDDAEASLRLSDIENYAEYINNDMPDGYRALTYITKRPGGRTWLYTMNEEGEFERFYKVYDMHQFMGDKVYFHDDQVYLYNSDQELAAQPLTSIVMVNVEETSLRKRYLEIKLESAKRRAAIAQRALRAIEP